MQPDRNQHKWSYQESKENRKAEGYAVRKEKDDVATRDVFDDD